MKCSEQALRSDDDAVARKLAALAHPVRLQLLKHLGAADACCVKDLVARVGLAQSTVSQHLKVLVEADLVGFRADRQSSRYSVNAPALRALAGAIGQTIDYCCAGCRTAAPERAPTDPRHDDAIAAMTGHEDI